jgi:hypothetical protein
MTSTTIATSTYTTECPAWCTGEHENRTGQSVTPAGDLYGGQVVHESARSQYGAGPAVHIQQYDDRGRTVQDVVLDRWDLSEGEAHELGMALVRAADRIRRARTEAGQ